MRIDFEKTLQHSDLVAKNEINSKSIGRFWQVSKERRN